MKSPYRNYLCFIKKKFFFYTRINFFYSAKYNRTERLCIFLMVASYCVHIFILRCMFCYFFLKDATIRPVLKHGPRSSTGLRVVEFLTQSSFNIYYYIYLRGEAKAKLCDVFCNRNTAAQADYGYAQSLRLCVYSNFFFAHSLRKIII